MLSLLDLTGNPLPISYLEYKLQNLVLWPVLLHLLQLTDPGKV